MKAKAKSAVSIAEIEQRAAQLRQRFAPILFTVPVTPELARHLLAYALDQGCSPETVIAEAVRSYLGDI